MTPREPFLAEAQRLLSVVAPGDTRIAFQTFDDNEDRKADELAKVSIGTLDKHAQRLMEFNARGAGVFFTVNQSDGVGRKKQNITQVRAVFADTDGAPLEPILASGLTPHVVVESSPGNFHVYWLVSDCPLHAFEWIQKAIAAKYGTDSSVSDLPRVLRVPGFWHCKGEPFQTRIVQINDLPAYPIQTVIDTLGLERVQKAAPDAPGAPTGGDSAEDLLGRLERGEALHDAILRIVAQMAKRGLDAKTIRAAALGLLERAQRLRPKRVAQLSGSELNRMIDSALAKFSPMAGFGIEQTDDAGSDGSTTPADGGAAEDEDKDDMVDVLALLKELPSMPDAALYGPIGDFAKAAADVSEASVQAIYATALTQLSVTAARCFCVQVGHENVPIGVSTVLTGPSGKGRKGTAGALVEFGLMPPLRKQAEDAMQVIEFVEELAQSTRDTIDRLQQEINARREALSALEGEAEAPDTDGARQRVEQLRAAIQHLTDDMPNHLAKPRGLRQREAHLESLKRELDQAEQVLAEVTALVEAKAKFDADPVGYRAAVAQEIEELKRQIRFMQEGDQGGPTVAELPVHELARPPHVMRGLSSGEGIVERICDPRTKPNGEQVGTKDKRLLIDVSEFGAVLSVLSREGNTGSANLRDGIDGRTIQTTGRTDPATATDPHMALSGHITGAEFMKLAFGDKRSTEADNGLLNRMLFVFTTRTKLVALPGKVPEAEVYAARIWSNLQQVQSRLQPIGETHATPIEFDAEGEAEWRAAYEHLTRLQGESREATALMQRAEWHARKVAALIAILNGEATVSAPAVRAAVALVAFVTDSVNRIAAGYKQRLEFAQRRAHGQRILERLTHEPQSARDVRRATKLNAKEFSAGLHFLTDECSPALARIGSRQVPRGNNAGMQTFATVGRVQ